MAREGSGVSEPNLEVAQSASLIGMSFCDDGPRSPRIVETLRNADRFGHAAGPEAELCLKVDVAAFPQPDGVVVAPLHHDGLFNERCAKLRELLGRKRSGEAQDRQAGF